MSPFTFTFAVGCASVAVPTGEQLTGSTAPPDDPTPADTDTVDTDDTDTPGTTGPTGDTGAPLPLSNRDRLLAEYLAHLELDPNRAQSNGMRGADLDDVCDLWDSLDLSSRATFLTVTARLEGSILAYDGSSMLDHVTTAYRIVGGEDASGA